MTDKTLALVTGANQGVGFQIASDLAAQGFTVIVGTGDLAKGEEAAKTIDGDPAKSFPPSPKDQPQ